MILNQITDKLSGNHLHLTQSEILIIDWSVSPNVQFYVFDKSKKLRTVNKDYFGLKTVGKNYKKIERQLKYPLENYCSSKGENGDIYFCAYQENKIYQFDKHGNKALEWQVEFGKGHPIYDIKFESPNFLWLAFPTGQTVSKVSIAKKEEIFKIGEYSYDDDSELLSYPESIFLNKGYLYIPNMGNNRLYKMELKTKTMTLIKTFDEKIWQYAQTEFGAFIVTDSGIYEIKE